MRDFEKEAEEYVPNINWHAYSSKELREEMMLCYQKGAEPREKRIEELETTIGTLRTFSNEQATCIERLEKENAELKEQVKGWKALQELYDGKAFKCQEECNELRKENKELKEHHESVCKNLTDTHRNIREQLTRATY